MARWLVREGDVLAALDVASTHRARLVGLLGRDGFDGALLLRPSRAVHTIGMRFPIDVAFCDRNMRVIDMRRHMGRHRFGRPRWGARMVIEAEAGAFERWQLRVGDQLEVKGE
jgi:uncharacterized membrane protein (UPF0127 family)